MYVVFGTEFRKYNAAYSIDVIKLFTRYSISQVFVYICSSKLYSRKIYRNTKNIKHPQNGIPSTLLGLWSFLSQIILLLNVYYLNLRARIKIHNLFHPMCHVDYKEDFKLYQKYSRRFIDIYYSRKSKFIDFISFQQFGKIYTRYVYRYRK